MEDLEIVNKVAEKLFERHEKISSNFIVEKDKNNQTVSTLHIIGFTEISKGIYARITIKNLNDLLKNRIGKVEITNDCYEYYETDWIETESYSGIHHANWSLENSLDYYFIWLSLFTVNNKFSTKVIDDLQNKEKSSRLIKKLQENKRETNNGSS